MIIVLAQCGNGYCGCDSEDAFFFEDGTSAYEMNETIYDWAVENAESFAHVHFGWDEVYFNEEWEDYIENHVEFDFCIATYEEYVEWCYNWGCEPKVFN